MSEIIRKLSPIQKIEYVFVELHSKGQSRMNQGYPLHDFYLVTEDTVEEYYMEPIIKRKIKTRNHDCYDKERYIEQTECLNNFYMSKLNCTFPWLESILKESQEKCGPKHFIKDLIDLIENVSKGIILFYQSEFLDKVKRIMHIFSSFHSFPSKVITFLMKLMNALHPIAIQQNGKSQDIINFNSILKENIQL